MVSQLLQQEVVQTSHARVLGKWVEAINSVSGFTIARELPLVCVWLPVCVDTEFSVVCV